MSKILIVDDEEKLRTALSVLLEGEGYDVIEAESGEEALKFLQTKELPDVVITDNRMSGMAGLDLLKNITINYPSIDTIVITAFDSSSIGAEAFKNGALEFLSKPFDTNILLTHIKSALNKKEYLQNSIDKNVEIKSLESFKNIIGLSKPMIKLQKLCAMAAPRNTTVLVRGPSGSGKELVARAIHDQSGRNSFLAINCGAVSQSLLESELFGHEKGAFTGAHAEKIGYFESSNDGTIFLDEIGDVSLEMQVKLLRVLQEKEFTRVGGNKTLSFNGRVIAATHKDLEVMVKEGTFREDLYFRLNIFPIKTPSLAERKDDISDLVEYFLNKLGHKAGVSPEAMLMLENHLWPGNVRELANCLERAEILSEGLIITREHLPFGNDNSDELDNLELLNDGISLPDVEKKIINDALNLSDGNKAKAARLLGITRRVLYSKIKRHGIGDS